MKTLAVSAHFQGIEGTTGLERGGGGGGGGQWKKSRSKNEESNNFPHLPEEIILNLLSRLPGKSLARFICVSKLWGSLIVMRQKNNKLLLIMSDNDSSLRSVDPQGMVKPFGQPWELKTNSCIRILGSCDGLVLIWIDRGLFLWNPLTRYFKKVLSNYVLRHYNLRSCSGLCYDSSADEYMAVLAFISEDGGDFVVIGSLRSKCWTEIQFPYLVVLVRPGPVVNGHLHWLAFDKIIKFIPQMKAFTEVPMPQPKHGDRDIIIGLGALEGCLSVARFYNQNSNSQGNVEVLVMKEFGGEKTWTTMFIISNSTRFDGCDWLVPLYLTHNGEILVKTHIRWGGKFIQTYNTHGDCHRDIQIPSYWLCLDEVQYEESLVVPIGYEWEEEDTTGKVKNMELST